mmetsp:Transcript_118781/g.236607  ORF Transcript_118781/g.236607 Transcript_118781/m.236607 type:complete len:242 (-) Transcript_118781:122-847(-)
MLPKVSVGLFLELVAATWRMRSDPRLCHLSKSCAQRFHFGAAAKRCPTILSSAIQVALLEWVTWRALRNGWRGCSLQNLHTEAPTKLEAPGRLLTNLATAEAAPVLRQMKVIVLAVVAKHTGAVGGSAAGAHAPSQDAGFGSIVAVETGAETEVQIVVEAAAARGNPRQQPSQRHPPIGAQIHLAASLAAAIINVTCRTSAARTNLRHALWLHYTQCLRLISGRSWVPMVVVRTATCLLTA